MLIRAQIYHAIFFICAVSLFFLLFKDYGFGDAITVEIVIILLWGISYLLQATIGLKRAEVAVIINVILAILFIIIVESLNNNVPLQLALFTIFWIVLIFVINLISGIATWIFWRRKRKKL